MLCLSRKREQKITIEGPCVITILEIRRDVVRVGIEADTSVNIVRNELIESSTTEEFKIEDQGVSVG
jgi:carbon storage regulator CsrA